MLKNLIGWNTNVHAAPRLPAAPGTRSPAPAALPILSPPLAVPPAALATRSNPRTNVPAGNPAGTFPKVRYTLPGF